MLQFRSTWSRFEFRKPRHPLLRFGLGVLGVGVLALLLVFGLFVGLAMLAGAAAIRLVAALLRQGRAPAAGGTGGVIDGEYTVVRKPHPPLASR